MFKGRKRHFFQNMSYSALRDCENYFKDHNCTSDTFMLLIMWKISSFLMIIPICFPAQKVT